MTTGDPTWPWPCGHYYRPSTPLLTPQTCPICEQKSFVSAYITKITNELVIAHGLKKISSSDERTTTGRWSYNNIPIPPRSLTPLYEQFTEEDKPKNTAIASMLDSYYAEALKAFTQAQRVSDTVSQPDKDGRRLFKIGRSAEKSTAIRGITPAAEFVRMIPEASYAWSMALRAKVLESEQADKEKQRIEDCRHWDPYPDID